MYGQRDTRELLRDPRPIGGGADDPENDPGKGDPPDPDPKDEPGKGDPDFKAEAEKWKALSRKHEAQAKANAEAAKRVKELEDADKSEAQKAADKAAEAEKRAADATTKALRYEVAADKDVPLKLVRFLTGTTQEEIEESADALLEALGEAEPDDKSKPKTKPTGRPKERLSGGGDPTQEPEEMDPVKLAGGIPRH